MSDLPPSRFREGEAFVTDSDQERGNPGALRWGGLMAGLNPQARSMAYVMLLISTVAMIFTQLGFVAVGSRRLFLALVPIAVGALMYGTLPGTLLGLVAGVAALAHATLLPLDYYEKFFASPFHSVVLFTLTGFLLGVAFHNVLSRPTSGKRGTYLRLAVACLVGSWFCSTLFQLGTSAIYWALRLEGSRELFEAIANYPGILDQIVLDAVLMALACIGAKAFLDSPSASEEYERSLRETFQTWLSVVFALAFMIIAALSYTGITVACIARANTTLDDHLDYLAGQLVERDRWITGLAEGGGLGDASHEELLLDSVSSLATDIPLGTSGVSIIAQDGTIISSSEESLVGRAFDEVIGSGLAQGFDEGVFDTRAPIEFYLGVGTDISYMKATQISYLRLQRVGKYQIAAILPGSEVFYTRTVGMVVESAVFAVLLGIVYLLALRLLDRVVVRGFDETNETLGRITEGDLDQVVDVHDSREFTSLSRGINSTVGALKESIAEASARVDRELATAKAIQASALPSSFPPFPEIDRFDIYASMNAAKEVGGDFYDFFLMDGDRLGIVMADVSGKGIPAALFMMGAKTEIEACMQSGMSLVEAVGTANWRLCHGNDAGMFVTVFAAVLDWRSGSLEYVNAGHNPPLVRRSGSWEWLRDKSGMFLGAFDEVSYHSFTTNLGGGDELLLYTDGVTEAMNRAEELYGEARLEALLSLCGDLGPKDLIGAVRQDLERYADGAEQADDITMLCVAYGVAPEVAGSIDLVARVSEFDRALGLVHAELARRVCPVRIQNQVDVCMEELFVNVVDYAYPDRPDDDPGHVRVSYTYRSQPQGITVEIADEGVPFDPVAHVRQAGDHTSLGLDLTRQIADEFSYRYENGSNITSFTKRW